MAVANHYLAQAAAIVREHSDLDSMTVGEATRRHRRQSLSPGEVAFAHLGSAAVRLATLCEITGRRHTENYRQKFYDRSGNRKGGWPASKTRAAMVSQPRKHLHLLLRDHIAHMESGPANTKHMASDRAAVLKTTTLATCSDALRTIARSLNTTMSGEDG